MVVFINDTFINEEEAKLNVKDLSIQRGFAIFDFFRTKNDVPIFFDDYLDRFYTSAGLIRLKPTKSRDEIKEVIYEMIGLNNIHEAGFKLILTGGYSVDGYEPVTPNFIILQQPLQMASFEEFKLGIKVMLHEQLRDLPTIKTTNYLIGIWLLDQLKARQADEVLYTYQGNVLEFPRSNVFIVTDKNVVITPNENVLKGITRKKVLELARKEFKVEERQVTVNELLQAKEVFLTSSTKRVLPVLKIEDKIIGDGKVGPISRQLHSSFMSLEESYIKSHRY